jgi:hypothetical protein
MYRSKTYLITFPFALVALAFKYKRENDHAGVEFVNST